MNFKDNIKRIRKENNLSQEALAEKLNVSRQAVSKWESGLAYPEMDKVVQICKMFNINIDELLNQNINEVKKDKESKSVVNKYIDDFLGFCTKTINMFSSMKFGQIVKCIIEQLIIIFVLGLLIQIFGGLLSSLFNSILSIFPQKAFTLLNNIFEGIYTFVMWALAVVILIHVFKTRYLDYYVVLDSEEKKEENEEQPEEVKAEEIKISDLQGKKFIKRKEEKIIIRDPKHSEDRFLKGLLKCILFFVKVFILPFALMLCFSLVSFSIALAMSLLFIKSGLIFVGMFIAIIACIVANVTILDLIYNFIVNRKSKLGVIGVTFFLSLVLFGFGVGLFAIGFKNFEMVEEYNEKYMNKIEETINMENGLFIETSMGELEYIESDNKDIKLVYETSKTYEINKLKDGNKLYINNNYHDGFKTLRYVLDNANDKVFVNPDYLKVTVYTNKDNIEKLKSNKENYYKNLRENEKNNEISRLQEENRKLRAEISELRNEE